MKKIFLIVSFFVAGLLQAQTDESKLEATIREFHQALVKSNIISINQQTDRALSYGHSNGWVETKTAMISNLETGVMKYNSFKEDSLQVTINGNMANARFVAEINATLKGTVGNFHLKVLEVWVRKGKRWILFARQAVRN